jgi:two-component system cell cycle sensor histidine kinase/response regulator CckA
LGDVEVSSGKLRRAAETSPEHYIILLALAAGLFAWIMRTALDFYFYSEKTLPGALLLDISHRELYSRVSIAAAFLLTGIIISRAVSRLKASEKRAHRLNQCVHSVRTINQLVTRVRDRSTLCQRSCDELVIGLGYERVRARLDGVTRGCAELPHTDTGAQATSASEPVTIPIICDSERLGELIVTPSRETEWDAEERALLSEVAEDIAFSIAMMSVAEHVRQQKEEIQTILDSVAAYISYKDRGGRYIRVNKARADVAHIPQQDWIGRTFAEIVPTCEEVGTYADEEVLATGRARHSPLEALELPAETRWIQSDRVPYRNGSSVAGVITLACKDEQLRQSQKMEAIGQLAGGIAHDFNNLLTAISGYTELARAELEPSDSASEMLFAVSKAADRAAVLTRQLLAFGRKQPLRLDELDLNDVVLGMTDMLERLIGADIELVTKLDENLGKIEADTSQIEQVVMNLAVNARDAMPHGGQLAISTSVVDPGEAWHDENPEECDRDYVCLRVTDTGLGMDSKTMAQIFEPFYTTKRPGVGTGLGLSVVDGIAEQHGGWVDVQSEPERGTSFSVCLPVAPERPPEDNDDQCVDNEVVMEAPAASGERVLLVEDEDSVRAFATRALTDWGYDVVEAASAEEALVALESDPSGFDLIFSDIVLPGRSGTQLAEEASTRNPDTRILLSSGYLFPEESGDDQSTSKIGFPMLKKPYSARGLRTAIHEVLS